MVKPSINPEGGLKKDDLKEAKGKEASLPAFAVIPLGTDLPPKKDESEEAAPIPVVNRPRKLGVCVCVSMLLVLLLIIGLAIAMFLGHASGKYTFRCGVKYNDDNPEKDYKEDSTLEEDVEVDPFKGYEQIEIPEQSYCERLTILHDFTVNMTAYRLHRSMICYITWLDKDIVMGPSEFIERAEENPEFLTDHYEMVHETYRAVLPELYSLNYGFGYYIPMLCDGVESYWIEKIPKDELEEWEEYWDEREEEEGKSDEDEDDDDDDFEPHAPPRPDHRYRRGLKESKKGVTKARAFVGKLSNIEIYGKTFVQNKKTHDKLAA